MNAATHETEGVGAGGAVAKAKERFKMPASARVVSCDEAGRDGFWLHRELEREGERLVLVERQIEQLEATRRERLQNPRSEAERRVVHLIRLGAIGPTSAWLWLRFQPKSALSQWVQARFAGGGLRLRRIGIVALARKLLIALWRTLEDGVMPQGARLIASEI